MSTLPTRGRRWIKRYFEIKGTKEYFFPPSPNLSNYILLALSRIHEPFVSRMRVVLPSFCSLSLSLSPPLPAKYPDKMPLVEISGEPVSWKFSGTSRPDVRVSSSIGPSHRQHRCSLSTEISIFPPVRIYSAPGVPILSFTLVHSSSFYDLSATTTTPKEREDRHRSFYTPQIKFIERFTFIFIKLTLPFVKLSSIGISSF